MARPGGALLFGLLLGGAAGAAIATYVAGGGASSRLEVAGAKEGRAPRVDGSASEAPTAAEIPPLAEPTRTSDDGPSDSAAPADVVADATELARRAPTPTRRGGSKSIVGRVADRDGNPLGGVVIRARRTEDSGRTPGRSRAGEGAPPDSTLEQAVRSAVEGFYAREADRRETKSGSDGTYAFRDLREGTWWIEAWAEGFQLERADAARGGVTPDATVDLKATPIVRVRVAVALADGTPAPKAAVLCRRLGEKSFRRSELWSLDQPLFPLEPGAWEVRASLGDPETGPPWPDALVSDVLPITTAAGVAPPDLSLRLHGSPGIRGRVRLPAGSSRNAVVVKVAPLPANVPPDLASLASDHEATNVWSHDGVFVFRDLAPGRYVVGASRGWNERIAAHAVVEVRDSMVEQDLEVPPLDPSRCLVVRVTGPEGHPLENVTFELRTEVPNGGSSSRQVQAERKPTGNFWVPLDPVDAMPDLTAPWKNGLRASLVASVEGLGSRTGEFTAGQRALEIAFTSPALLNATVAGFVGSGLEGRLHLSLVRPQDDGSRTWSSHDTGLAADGTEKFGPVEPGAWRLVLELQPSGGNRWERQQVAALDVSLVAGENAATIALPQVHTLTLQFEEGGGWAQVKRVGGSMESGRSAQVDESGKLVVEGLVAGEYEVTSMGPGEQGIMRVHVPASGTVRFQAMPVNALAVKIEKPDGKLAQAGLRDGDLIVAVDGTEFSTMAELQAAVLPAFSRKEVTFAVLRGRDRLEVKVDGRSFMKPDELGGSIEPTTR
jgi:hypothetical protein